LESAAKSSAAHLMLPPKLLKLDPMPERRPSGFGLGLEINRIEIKCQFGLVK